MYRITALRRIYNTKNPHFLEYGFEQLAKFLTIPREGTKIKDQRCTIPAWSPASFNGKGLKSEHVTHVSCMVYDIDDGLLFDNHKRFDSWQYIAYSSPSHSVCKHKWRLVIPFEDPIDAKYWPWVWASMVRFFEKKTNSLLSGGNVDPVCKDQRRFYFLGKNNKQFESHINNKGYNFWVNMEQIINEKENQEEAQRKAMAKQKQLLRQSIKKPARNRDIYNELRMNLNINIDHRRTLAERIGGRITNGANPRVVGWDCPQCHKNDCTFFYLNPVGNKISAFCNHRNSCGMSMGLFELGRIKGVF